MSQLIIAKWSICRICLKSENKRLYNIFEPIVEEEIADLGTSLVEKIELCGAIKLDQRHNFPQKICSRCVLLLRAAYKFRDLCQQSQNQLKQFITSLPQKEDSGEDHETGFDYDAEEQRTNLQEEDAEEQKTEIQEECNLLLADDDYVIEESVVEFDETSFEQEPNFDSKNGNLVTTIDENVVEIQDLSDDDDSNYVVAHDPKEITSEVSSDEITKYKDEIDKDDKVIVEEQHKQLDNRNFIKSASEKNITVKRKRSHNQVESVNGIYSCMFCNNAYTDKPKYNNHMKIHANEKPHECEICNKRFSTTPQLSRHMNSHTGNRPYKCQYCEASFGDPSTKIKHERIHTNERPYKCDYCNKAFAYSNVLKVHMMTHTGEKPHACGYCGRTFSQVHHKNAHEKRHKASMLTLQNSSDNEFIEEDDLKDFKIEEI